MDNKDCPEVEVCFGANPYNSNCFPDFDLVDNTVVSGVFVGTGIPNFGETGIPDFYGPFGTTIPPFLVTRGPHKDFTILKTIIVHASAFLSNCNPALIFDLT